MAQAEIDLEAEYNNRARVPDHPSHIAGWQRDAAAYRETARCELDIAYGPGGRHRLDLFHPPGGDAGAPAIMFIHGGYWQALDKSSSSHLARGANERGFTVAVPSYDLAPGITLSGIVAEMETAADFLMHRLGRALVVTGHSAGGHLTACLMARSPKALRRPITAGMPISGLFDLVPLVPTSINRALGLTVEEARRLSPIYDTPPLDSRIVAVVGGAESAEFRRQSRDFVAQWSAMEAVARVHEVPGAHHFDVIAGLADPGDVLVETLVTLAAGA
ncbi:alpha/beta hydrolase [Microvirga thermotolerans]|uniref:Alpha/beta hydrolase fold domain-containing protein n=1 Tax=Microvirga thermotolerans TaxID=2651334 RepID=A0A5P9JV72_9HYPH|nr:alpha/beta hydrolase [Microvirga thermotolerans]QFU16507.1 alpha/beta hydrolase fold domain-containing protein [Microvirga thermotolerans]